MIRSAVAALVALVTAGCALAARDHPCYPYLVDRYHGTVPRAVVTLLAHERGARRTVRSQRAPSGWYWRRAGPRSLDVGEIRTLADGHELVPCPGVPVTPPAE